MISFLDVMLPPEPAPGPKAYIILGAVCLGALLILAVLYKLLEIKKVATGNKKSSNNGKKKLKKK